MARLITKDFSLFLRQSIACSNRVDLAVAFWGKGATGELRLSEALEAERNIRIICNLRIGGTNPDEIKKLINAGVPVRHSDRLHAKVYILDGFVIVGSANVSSNGLGFEGKEAHWDEANLLTDEVAIREEIGSWFEQQWLRANKVDDTDLEAAERNFRRTRAARPYTGGLSSGTLLEAVLTSVQDLEDRNIYLVCNDSDYSGETSSYVKRENSHGRSVEAYEDWLEMPADAVLIDFTWYAGARLPMFRGVLRSHPQNEPVQIGERRVFEVDRIGALPKGSLPFHLSDVQIKSDLSEWFDILREVRDASPERWHKEHGCCINIADISALIADRKQVLNVYDEHHRLKMEDGIGISGNWSRPDRLPRIIRVYQQHGGDSVAGGEIIKRVPLSSGRYLIHFRPDIRQIGRKWPEKKFRANGCVAT